jgi:hypothetical protein
MAEMLELPPFPPLMWDGLYWRTSIAVPWYVTAETPQLIVRPDYSRSAEVTEARSAPRPTSVQASGFQFVFDPETPLKQSLLMQFQTYVPELAEADRDRVQTFFALATVLIFHPFLDDISYTGFVFNCLHWEYGYEHGVGIVTHKERVVHFGMAEEAMDETQALKDLRRIARSRRGDKR